MAVEIDEAWLQSHGVDLEGQNANELVDAAMDELELRVGMEIAGHLSDKQIEEFENLGEEDDRLAWLEKALPDYPKIVERKYAELGTELEKSANKITLLKAWTAEA
jgi:hypothetical protein